jgi:hypothetical protein
MGRNVWGGQGTVCFLMAILPRIVGEMSGPIAAAEGSTFGNDLRVRESLAPD